MGSEKIGDGTLFVAGEAGTYNGPWVNPDDARKLNGLIRYTQGTALDGFSITGMAYSNRYNSTDQVPQRAITSGQLDRFGADTRPMAATPNALRCRRASLAPTMPDRGRPTPSRSKAGSNCSTTLPTFSEIRFLATSFVNTTTAS